MVSAAVAARLNHLGWSNARMNDSRYTASGSTQRNGTTAMSWPSCSVVETNIADENAESAIQVVLVRAVGAGSSSGEQNNQVVLFLAWKAPRSAATTYAAKPHRQIASCRSNPHAGSRADGRGRG